MAGHHRSRFAWLVLISGLFLLPPPTASAADVAFSCPPGWTTLTGGEFLTRCIAPEEEGFVEIYSYDGESPDMSAFLDSFVAHMAGRGVPHKTFRTQVPGNVSGKPALTREYSGTRDGVAFHSFVSAASHAGRTYALQALYTVNLAARLQPQIQSAMNGWRFPSAEARPAVTQPSGGRSFENRQQCLDTLCRPFHAACKDYDIRDRRYNFRYLLCDYTWDLCYGHCDTYWSLSLACTKEAMAAAQGYWAAACFGLSHDQKAMTECFRRGQGDLQSRFAQIAKDPQCKPATN